MTRPLLHQYHCPWILLRCTRQQGLPTDSALERDCCLQMGEGLEGKCAGHAVGVDHTAQEGGVKVSQVERRGIRYGGSACRTQLSLSTAPKTAYSKLSLGLLHELLPLHVLGCCCQVTCSGQVQGTHNTSQLAVVCKRTQRGGQAGYWCRTSRAGPRGDGGLILHTETQGLAIAEAVLHRVHTWDPLGGLALHLSICTGGHRLQPYCPSCKCLADPSLLQDPLIHWQVLQQGRWFK